jgi:fatty-acyl-CoA synthase
MERLTLGALFDRVALGVGEREAVVFTEPAVRWGYRDTHTRVVQVAKGLIGLGVDTGDRIAVWATNRPEWVLLQLAAAKVGALLVPLDPAAGPDELTHALGCSGASTLFLSERHDEVSLLDVFTECCPEIATARPARLASRRLPALKRVAFLGDGEEGGGVIAWSDVLRAGSGITDHLLRRRQDGVEAGDAVTILFTAGATGEAKGVVLSHLNLVNEAFAVGEVLRLTRQDRVCVSVPFHRGFGCGLGTLGALGRGATMVVASPTVDASKTLAAIAAERCTALYGEPRFFASALRRPEAIRLDLRSLRTGLMIGAACPPEIVRETIERLHVKELTVAYGQTEATAVITQTRIEDSLDLRMTTVGRALPHVEVRIVDPKTGVELRRGDEGELCCRGFPVMLGYHDMPEATAAVVGQNGWLRTGDLAVMDQHGYCAITGRVARERPISSSARVEAPPYRTTRG